ncbi:hybrid sensor histidine kinase/response regulator transcription factor [Chitinophaga sp. sic0106]|uniref:hybrid sensor histidine kinase/response regulator transcription factor n=1 Tax=Chitinophaga sp. sic0106 TaxID=2854785 RepID=UPI001C44C70D|nr:hybrid sensor histidine kinase/response regulator transcription factor [Chitinophaga sp. sic0106]MBV7529145.1 response regulator [Chitinophaga sp. sic0106]
MMYVGRFPLLKYFFICTLLFFFLPSFAQENRVNFTRLGIAQGLPQSTVHCILQDSKGFIWIGTENGLCRYSDDEIKIFRYSKSNKSAISSNFVYALAEDDKGNILVGTANGLNIYDTRKEAFRLATGAPGVHDICAIYKDAKNRIWVGAASRFFSYHSATEELRRIPQQQDRSNAVIRALAEDKDGNLWIGYGISLLKYNPTTGVTQPGPAQIKIKSTIHCITLHNSEIWVGTQGHGLHMFDTATSAYINYQAGDDNYNITNEMVKAVKFIGDDCWVGTRRGIYVLRNREVVAHYTNDKYDPGSLSYNSVCSIIQDKAGTIWIGTYWGGVSQVHPGSDMNYISWLMKDGIGMNSRIAMAVAEDKQRNLWIATAAGLNYYNPVEHSFKYYRIPSPTDNANTEIIKSVLVKDDQHIIVGSLEGLYLFNIPSHSFTRLPLKSIRDMEGKRNHACYALEKGKNGWWIGTENGLYFLDKTLNSYSYHHNVKDYNSLTDGEINCLYEDKHGTLWVGTTEGLCYLPYGSNKFTRISSRWVSMADNPNNIHCIREDSHGYIWAGTHDFGLMYVDTISNMLKGLGMETGLSDIIIRGIVEDDAGNLWLSGQDNIMKVLQENPGTDTSRLAVTNYGAASWAGTTEYLSPAVKTRNGDILFGGINGIVRFNPATIFNNTARPQVILTGMLIKNIPVNVSDKNSPLKQSVTYTDNITLTHDQAYFTLHFAALNYINPASNQFAYKMEGLHSDNKWHYVGHQTSATFTNLDPGNYTFKVKAANNDGLWSQTPTELHIKVLPPLWKTWYAYLFYVLVLAGLLLWYYYYTARTTLLKHEILKQQVFREKERELAKNKMDFFTNISHDIKTPLTLIMAPVETLLQQTTTGKAGRQQLLLIQQNGERLMRLMDQLLDFRRLEEGGMPLKAAPSNIVVFCKEIVSAFESLAATRHITLAFTAQQPEMIVWFDPDKLEKILFNLLSNALKFTQTGGKVEVSLHFEGDKLLLQVADNGIGIPETHFDKVFGQFNHYDFKNLQPGGTGIGLAFVKGLVARHYGTINLESSVATGTERGYTCFSIRIPVGKEHLSPAEMEDAGQVSMLRPELPEEHLQPVMPADEGDRPVMLIVEDNKDVLKYLADMFRAHYTLHLAADGLQGLELATTHLPDIIISDVMMPGMNGVELCHTLKNDTRTSHIPVIMLSARSTVAHIQEGYETGADDYVTKPFSVTLLTTRVQNLLDSRRRLREKYSQVATLAPDEIPVTGPDDIFLKTVITYIEENIAEPTLNVEDLATAVSMSRITLYRKLKALTNQTTIEFIRSIRLRHAARLLATQQYNVNEVAYMVGFSDVDYFRKWFKKEFNQLPSEYRRN